jgi:hypothetical protein
MSNVIVEHAPAHVPQCNCLEQIPLTLAAAMGAQRAILEFVGTTDHSLIPQVVLRATLVFGEGSAQQTCSLLPSFCPFCGKPYGPPKPTGALTASASVIKAGEANEVQEDQPQAPQDQTDSTISAVQ